jgi:hypothetical protein
MVGTMSDNILKEKLIRLAHSNPGKVRNAILPLLKEGGAAMHKVNVTPTRFLASKKVKAVTAQGATVRDFNNILAHRLTRYDRLAAAREQKRGLRVNIYRMGHLLGAAQKAVDLVPKALLDSDGVEALEAYRKGLKRAFRFEAGKFEFAPVTQVSRMMDKWIASGKLPKF